MDCVCLPVSIYFPSEILAFIANNLKKNQKPLNQALSNSFCIRYTALRFPPGVQYNCYLNINKDYNVEYLIPMNLSFNLEV